MSLLSGEHGSWARPHGMVLRNLAGVDLKYWASWVVKLQFKKDGKETFGTGFFVNIDSTRFSVVLTAGHNLISDEKKPVEDLKILGTPSTPGEPSTPDVPISEQQIRICEAYRQRPGSSNKPNDYGALLLPYDSEKGGFGLSLELGLSDRIDSVVHVHGHDSTTAAGSPLTSSGSIKLLRPDYVQYDAATVPGNSGGPVFVVDKKNAIAVAVHNYQVGQMETGIRQGTRLGLDVLRTVCHWAEVGWFAAPIKVDQKGVPSPGLFLQLPRALRTSRICGRVSRGPGRPATTFDILICFTHSGLRSEDARYAFLVNKPEPGEDEGEDSDTDDEFDDDDNDDKERAVEEMGPCWIHWRATPMEISLSSTFADDCLVRLKTKGTCYQIIRNMYKLRLQDDDIDPVPACGILPGQEALYQGSRLSFIPEKNKVAKFAFCVFSFG